MWRLLHGTVAALALVALATGPGRRPEHAWLATPLVPLVVAMAAGARWRDVRLAGAFARVAIVTLALLSLTGVALALLPSEHRGGARLAHRALTDVLLPALGAHALLAIARRLRRPADVRGTRAAIQVEADDDGARHPAPLRDDPPAPGGTGP